MGFCLSVDETAAKMPGTSYEAPRGHIPAAPSHPLLNSSELQPAGHGYY